MLGIQLLSVLIFISLDRNEASIDYSRSEYFQDHIRSRHPNPHAPRRAGIPLEKLSPPSSKSIFSALTQLASDDRLNSFHSPHFSGLYQLHMDETLRQLGELLLGSVPTVILLAVLYALYTAIVHKPLRRVLEERRSKTEGAVEKSRADIAAAEARTAEYEQKLREARAVVFRAQEAKRQAVLQARTNALNEARTKAQAQVQAAKKDIEADRIAAESTLPADAAALAEEIVRRVLQPAGAGR
jgi:F-type H+-transporting ATPase subunit b